MTLEWYRSDRAPMAGLDGSIQPSVSRRVRNWLRGRLPEPDVRGKTIVLHARQGFPKRTAWAGLFSEFHSVLGALAYAETHGAAGVRVDFHSPLYLDARRGPNWWTYFFESAEMPVQGQRAQGHRAAPPSALVPFALSDDGNAGAPGEVHLNRTLAKYGRHGGFCDVVNGTTPYLYPMTYGIGRKELHRLLTTYIRVRPEIQDEVARWTAASLEPGAYVVGVHYRGTDSTHGFAGRFLDYRRARVPYETYAAEVRAAVAAAAPRAHQLLVATDEVDFVDFMRREFRDRVACVESSPRVAAGGRAIHLDDTLPVSNYEKGKSGLVDCLLLAAASYLVKGRSNLSDASLAFNPRLPYSFCVR